MREPNPTQPQSLANHKFLGNILAILSGLILAWLFYPTIRETLEIAWTDEDYSHGLLLPIVTAYVLYERRNAIKQTIQSSRSQFSWVGLSLLVFGASVYLVGEVANLHFIRWFALFPCLFGTLALLFGLPTMLILLPPIGLLFMAKPLPDAMVPKLFFPLQVFSARIAAQTLDLLSVPVYLRGNIIEIPGMELMVEQACSGLRSLLALLTVALIVILTLPMPRLFQIFLLFASALTAVALNVIRVTLTGVLAHFYDPAVATGFFHTFSGMVVFLVGLALIYGLAIASNKSIQNKAS